MHKSIKFTKMHGAGNDYIYIDETRCPIDNPSDFSRRWSDRHKGIGADGLVLIGRPESGADFSMRIFNADGSEAMMCGNASRCIGKYVYERGLTNKTTVRLLTLSGIKTLMLDVKDGKVESVTVDMLEPKTAVPEQFLGPVGNLPKGTFVSMGNPHYVVFTDDVDRIETDGPRLERHEAFPQRCNIEYVKVEPDGSLRTRVWERGSGITLACGTGACATAVAACINGKAGRESTVVMDGGTLHIRWDEATGHVMLTGGATFVFDGETL